MKFTHEIFTVEVVLDDLSHSGTIGEYRIKEKQIALDYAYIKEVSKTQEHAEEELRRVLHHELAHFFDFNCWNSWSYKETPAYEHLAVFVEIYFEYIRAFTELIVTWVIEEEGLIENEEDNLEA